MEINFGSSLQWAGDSSIQVGFAVVGMVDGEWGVDGSEFSVNLGVNLGVVLLGGEFDADGWATSAGEGARFLGARVDVDLLNGCTAWK